MASTQTSSDSFILPKWRRIHWRDISTETENEGCHAATSESCLPYFHHEGEVQEKLNYYYLEASTGKVQFEQKQVDKIQNGRKPRHRHPNVEHHLRHTSANPCPQQCDCCYCKRCANAGVEVHSDIKRKIYQSRHFMSPSLTKKTRSVKEVLVRGRKRSRIPALESYDEDSPSTKELRAKPKMEIRHRRPRHLTRAYRKCPIVR
jgi:hypothetical protein